MNDCSIGWGGARVGKARLSKYLTLLRMLAELLDKDFEYIDKRDVKFLLGKIDADPNKNGWEQHRYRLVLRKFVSWLREEHGYPEDYPNAEHLSRILSLLKYPTEVLKMKIKCPNKIKPRDELDGFPRSVQLTQRGWSPSSKMPDKYAAIIIKDVDAYFRKKFCLNGGEEEKEKRIKCPRCRDVNFPQTLCCRRCGLPLSDKAKKYDEAIDDLMAKILLDPELSQRLREKLFEVKVGDGVG